MLVEFVEFVVFSFEFANATFVNVPLVVRLTCIHSLMLVPLSILAIFQTTLVVPLDKVVLVIEAMVTLPPALTNTNPAGSKSVTLT